MEKSYKFRIYPNRHQAELIRKTIGCCRFVYNDALSARISQYKMDGSTLSRYDCVKRLPDLKQQNEWLKEVDSTALQAAVEHMDSAYQNFFKGRSAGRKVGFPKFKSRKRSRWSYKTKVGIKIAEKKIRLSKLGWVDCRVSTAVKGRILSATVSMTSSGKFFVSLCCTDVDMEPFQKTGQVVGIDLGLKSLVVTSDGNECQPHKYLRKSEAKLARLQRQLSRKPKDSRNREKARLKVARLHEHIANQRMDALHKLTTDLVKSCDVICAEDLSVKNMLRNHCLAKSISDASWGELLRQLDYKCRWYGKEFIQINRFFASSQTCNVCGYKDPAVKDLSVREWTCPQCGAHHDRDANAAVNILAEGLKMRANAA